MTFKPDGPMGPEKKETEQEKAKRVSSAVHHALQTMEAMVMYLNMSKNKEEFLSKLKGLPFMHFKDALNDFSSTIKTTQEEARAMFGDIEDVYENALKEVLENEELDLDDIRSSLQIPTIVFRRITAQKDKEKGYE